MSDKTAKELELTYNGVYVAHRNLVIVPAEIDKFVEDERDHAFVCYWFDNDWSHELIDDNSICGVVVIKEPQTRALNIGVDGRVDILEADGQYSVEFVDQSDRGPNYSKTLQCVREINGSVYVAGMARQVYRREGPNNWTRWDNGIYVPRGQRTKAVGILDIDGVDNALYAVGYKGEIWSFDGQEWAMEASPTNVALTGVDCVSNGDVYVVGLVGTILRGSRGAWSVIEQETTREDFWGVASFKDSVYVSNDEGVFVLQDDDIIPVDFGLGRSLTTAYLDAADGVMWSVGNKDIAYTEDGKTWVEAGKP